MVAETVVKAYEFYRRAISNSMGGSQKIPILRLLCADYPRNWGEDVAEGGGVGGEAASTGLCCKYCGQGGKMQSREVSVEQLIDSAAFIATAVSMVSIVNFHLSTSCSGLQKQSQSLASLSCDSYMDIIHLNIKQSMPAVAPLVTAAADCHVPPPPIKTETGENDAALHAQTLKYGNESQFSNYKEDIQYTYNNSECACVNKISDFLSKIKL